MGVCFMRDVKVAVILCLGGVVGHVNRIDVLDDLVVDRTLRDLIDVEDEYSGVVDACSIEHVANVCPVDHLNVVDINVIKVGPLDGSERIRDVIDDHSTLKSILTARIGEGAVWINENVVSKVEEIRRASVADFCGVRDVHNDQTIRCTVRVVRTISLVLKRGEREPLRLIQSL